MPLANLSKSLINESWQKDWFLLLFIKLGVATFLPFFSDEAYYWVWSQNLKLSYFDHPPFISWLFLAGNPIENFYFAGRLPTVLMGHLTIWIWCAFIAKDFPPSNKRKLFWILSVHTLVGFGSLVANPDVPFLFFWSLSVLFFIKSLEKIDSKVWPILLGISLGLGFCSKYLLALFAPAALFYLFISGNWRKLKWAHLVLPVFFGALFSAPVWIWNYNSDWASFKFQIDHGLGKTWNLKWTSDFLLGTAFLLFPPFIYIYFKNKLYKSSADFNSILFSVLMVFFIYTTTGGDTELNWPLALYPSFFMMLVPYLDKPLYNKIYFGIFGGLGCILILFAMISPGRTPHSRLTEGGLYKKLYLRSENYSPLYTSTYQSASYFWFLAKKPFYKLRFSSRIDEFDNMSGSLPEEEIFYFLKEQYQVIPRQHLETYRFEKVADLDHNFEIYKAIKK